MIGNCIIAQSGGPTAVINASVYGVFNEAAKNPEIQEIYAADHGIIGVLNQELFDLRKEPAEEIELLKTSPSSALGSCRYRINTDEDLKKIFKIFELHNIRYFFYIGGNDSMDTANKIDNYAKKINYEIYVSGISKTIDNDLPITDHCPGFGSAAKYIATSVLEISKDAEIYSQNIITIVEVMGRHAGWLAASSILSKVSSTHSETSKDLGPDLVYLPEVTFNISNFIQDVKKIYSKKGKVLIVVSEGIKINEEDLDSNLHSNASSKDVTLDVFGHKQLGGVGNILGNIVKNKIEKRVKVLELGILQRCAAHIASAADIEEAALAGKMGVQYALQGKSGFMVGFERSIDKTGAYLCNTKPIPLSDVANKEKPFPTEWITEGRNYITETAIDYLKPLIIGEPKLKFENGLPKYSNLQKHFIEKYQL